MVCYPLLFRRKLHVIAVKALEVSFPAYGSAERIAFKFDAGYAVKSLFGEDLTLSVLAHGGTCKLGILKGILHAQASDRVKIHLSGQFGVNHLDILGDLLRALRRIEEKLAVVAEMVVMVDLIEDRQSALHRISQPVKRENINEYAHAFSIPYKLLLKDRSRIHDLGIRISVFLVVLISDDPISSGIGKILNESLIIASEHADIDIVIPRNKALVPYGSEQSSSAKEILKALCITKVPYGSQNIELGFLKLLSG